MNNESTYAKKFNALLKKMPESDIETPQRDAVTQMIIGFLQWDASSKQAELAYRKLMGVMVDNNDLRVSMPEEIAEQLGSRYPRSDERIERLRDSLQEVFVREHAIEARSLETKSKKDVRHYFDTLPGMVPYVSAMVCLLTFGAHAIPVDDKLADLLKAEGVVDPDATIEEIERFLERQVKAGDGVDVHLRLQSWVEAGSKRVHAAKSSKKKVAKKAARKPAKKTTKKKTAKTTSKKKTTKRRVTKKK